MSNTITDTAAPFDVTDDKGRVLTVRKLDILAELDLIEAAGELSENRQWMRMATLACCVTAIDGVPRPFPLDKKGIRNQVKIVDGRGIAAVIKALVADLQEDVASGEVPPLEAASP